MSTKIPYIERLSSRVIRILGCNPGAFQLQGTNSYLVGFGKRRILIDTSDKGHPQYLENIKKILDEQNVKVQEIILTHWHHDHVGAVRELCRDVFKEKVKVSKLKRSRAADISLMPETDYTFLNGNETISTEGANLRVIHTPGHAEDHIALHLLEENAVFSGDCVLGEGTTKLGQAWPYQRKIGVTWRWLRNLNFSRMIFEDLYDYMASLEKIKSLNPTRIYPGHGPVVDDGMTKVTQYIDHRNMRERQIVSLLQSEDKWLHAMDLVKKMYADVPVTLHKAAMGNVLQHLGKLLKEDRVELDRSRNEFLSTLQSGSAEGATSSLIETLNNVRWHWKQSTVSGDRRELSNL